MLSFSGQPVLGYRDMAAGHVTLLNAFMGINPQMAYLWLSLYIKLRLETVFQNNSVRTQTSADNFTAVLPSPVVDGTPDQI